jgi:putative holliday junction resolvase
MRYLAIDYGKKRIGLAVGEKGLVAPLAVYPLDGNVFIKIKKICSEELIDRIILGVSDSLEKEIKMFGRKLEENLGLPVVFQDETLTTKEAVDRMIMSSTRRKSRREKIDAVAAAQILTSYFNERKK